MREIRKEEKKRRDKVENREGWEREKEKRERERELKLREIRKEIR